MEEVSATDANNVAGGNDTIHMSYGRILALVGGGSDVLKALGSDNTGNANSRDTAIFAGDSAQVVMTPDDEALLVQLFETLVDGDGRTHFTGIPGSTGYSADRINWVQVTCWQLVVKATIYQKWRRSCDCHW